MARSQRDEPVLPAIADSTDTSTTDQKLPPNSCIDALEALGVIIAT